MEDQLLDGARGAVFRCPGLELVLMGEKQIGQEVSIAGIVLGAAGDEGFAIFLERDPLVAFQKADEMAGGLFQAKANLGLGMLLAQLEEPFPERFGAGVDDAVFAFERVGVDEVQIGLAIGAIQADDEVKRRRILHEHAFG